MKKNSQAFVNQLLACLLVTLCCGGSVGLGLVWMRHQISMTAHTNRLLTARIAEVERQIAATATGIESEQTLEVLRHRNEQWKLGLVPVKDVPVVQVTDDPVKQMLARSNREIFGDAAQDGTGVDRPAVISLPLAIHR